jgi:hypothetical protein
MKTELKRLNTMFDIVIVGSVVWMFAIIIIVTCFAGEPVSTHPPVGDIPLQQTCFTDLPETNFKDGAFRLSNELK